MQIYNARNNPNIASISPPPKIAVWDKSKIPVWGNSSAKAIGVVFAVGDNCDESGKSTDEFVGLIVAVNVVVGFFVTVAIVVGATQLQEAL